MARSSTLRRLLALTTLAALGGGCVEVRDPPALAPQPPMGHVAIEPPRDLGPFPTPTPTASATPSATTPTPSATPTDTPETPTPVTPTASPTPSPTLTPTPIPTPTQEDPDGDGYTQAQGDCDILNASVYPGAPEAPFDGVDSDCDGLQDRISTFAGARLNEGGDFLLARNAGIRDIARDGEGALYYVDALHCRVRKVTGGIVTTLAGTGTCGFAGDGGLALAAELSEPSALALDEAGQRLFFSDLRNHRVRVIDLATGLIDTFAGSGLEGTPLDGDLATRANLSLPYGLAWVPLSRTLYIAQFGSFTEDIGQTLWRVVDQGGDAPFIFHVAGNGELAPPVEGLAKESPLPGPFHVTVDALETVAYVTALNDERYVVEITEPLEAHAQLKVLMGGTDATACRSPIPEDPAEVNLCIAEGIEFSGDGGIYVALRDANAIIRYDLAEDRVETIAGSQEDLAYAPQDGPALEVPLLNPLSLTLDGHGGFYESETTNALIRHYTPGEGGAPATLTRVGGLPNRGYLDGPRNASAFYSPSGLDMGVDPETGEEVLYIADYNNNVVRQVKGGITTTIAGTPGVWGFEGDGGLAVDATLGYIADVAVDAFGTLYILESSRIRRVRDGYITTIAGLGERSDYLTPQPAGEADLNSSYAIALSDDGSKLFVSEFRLIRVIHNPAGNEAVIEPYVGNNTGGNVTDGANLLETSVNPSNMDWFEGELYFSASPPTQLVRTRNGKVEILAQDPELGGTLQRGGTVDALTVGPEGELYVAFDRDGVFRFDGANQLRLMGDGIHTDYNRDEGTGAQIYYYGDTENGLTTGLDGSLYISDGRNHVIRVLDW